MTVFDPIVFFRTLFMEIDILNIIGIIPFLQELTNHSQLVIRYYTPIKEKSVYQNYLFGSCAIWCAMMPVELFILKAIAVSIN